MNLFPVTRSLDYTVIQSFIVAADSAEEAEEQTTLFCESGWKKEDAEQHRLVQIGDEMEQIENSEEISVGEPIEGSAAVVDKSLRLLTLQGQAEAMFTLLKSSCDLGAVTDQALAASIKTLIEDLEATIAEPQSMLLTLVGEDR